MTASSTGQRPARPGLREAGVAFQVPEFRRFWIGALLSNSGGWMQNLAVPFVLFELTGEGRWIGIATFVQLLPAVLFGPLGGSLADRYPRRNILLVTQTGMAAASLAMWVLWSTGAAEPWSLVALVGVIGMFAGFNIASWQAFVTDLVPRTMLLNAVTLNSAQFNAARAVGPALAGLVLGTLGPGGAFLLNAVSFGFVLVALATIRPRPRPPVDPAVTRPSVFRETVDTVRYIRDIPGIRACVGAIAAVGFLGSPVFPLLPVFAENVFEVSGWRFGLLGAAMGLGGVIVAPLIAGPGTGVPRSLIGSVGFATYGGGLVAFALLDWYPAAIAVLVVTGGAYLAMASTFNTSIQLQVEEERRGKVLSLYVMGLTASYPLGGLLQGAMVDVVGVETVVLVAGSLLSAVMLWQRFGSRALVHLDDEPRHEVVADDG